MCCSGVGKFFEKPESEIPRTILPEELVFGYNQGEWWKGEMLKEARDLWTSSDGWRLDVKGNPRNGVPRVESCPARGSFAESGIRIWRAYAEIPSSATRTTQLLASPEGQAILDPSTTRQTLFDPVEIMEDHEDEILKVEHVVEAVPRAPKKHVFVLLNAANARSYSTNYVLSKSVLHPSLPGYSKYYNPVGEDGLPRLPEFFTESMLETNVDLYTRGLQTLAILIEPIVEDDSPLPPDPLIPRCAVTFVRWKDYSFPNNSCFHSSFDLTNRMNKAYFKPFYRRLTKKTKEIDKAKLSPPGALGESFY